jgi:hypothetical protein
VPVLLVSCLCISPQPSPWRCLLAGAPASSLVQRSPRWSHLRQRCGLIW